MTYTSEVWTRGIRRDKFSLKCRVFRPRNDDSSPIDKEKRSINMQPVDKKRLEKLIEEAKKEGKDTTALERTFLEITLKEPPVGKVIKTERGTIISTGPVKREDFEDDSSN